MSFQIPTTDPEQEQSLGWAQEANISWSLKDLQTRPLTTEEQGKLRQQTDQNAAELSPAAYVVSLEQAPKGTLLSHAIFKEKLERADFAPGTWAWDAKSAAWRQVKSCADSGEATALKKELTPAEAGVPATTPAAAAPGVVTDTTADPISPKFPSSDRADTVNEINVFKDDKQHIFYSINHLRGKIEAGAFSMADWGWDDESDDWIPLSELLPKISHHFMEDTPTASVDNKKLLERVEKLEAENNQLISERDKLKSAASASASSALERQDLETEIEQLKRQLEDSQRREARGRREFQAELDRSKQTHQAELESLQQKLYTLEKSSDELRDTLTQSEKTAQDKSDTLKASQMTRKQQEARIDELDDTVEGLKSRVKSLQSDLNLERKTLEERTDSETRLNTKVDELQESLREKKQAVEMLESEIADRKNDRDLIAAELREQMDRMATTSANLEKLAQRLDR